ncbi:MAG: hypothetical protein ACSHWR_01705 [Psychromonas sp.]
MKKTFIPLILSSLLVVPFVHGEGTSQSPLDFAQVTYVEAVQNEKGTWCFTTQVQHNDQGWAHYADAWQVLDLQGNVLGERKLLHPHDNEQPFTRSLCNVQIKPDVQKVVVRAKCNVHGWGEKKVTLDLLQKEDNEFTVKRHSN